MADQISRWQAFKKLREIAAELERGDVAYALLDDDGVLYVRSDWFCSHVRRIEPQIGPNAQIIDRMRRAFGWQRRGSTGRIKATDPNGEADPISWAFLVVVPGWEDALECDE